MSPQDAIAALVLAGWTEKAIADAVGTSQPSINRIKNNSKQSVRYEVGVKLIALAANPSLRKVA